MSLLAGSGPESVDAGVVAAAVVLQALVDVDAGVGVQQQPGGAATLVATYQNLTITRPTHVNIKEVGSLGRRNKLLRKPRTILPTFAEIR